MDPGAPIRHMRKVREPGSLVTVGSGSSLLSVDSLQYTLRQDIITGGFQALVEIE